VQMVFRGEVLEGFSPDEVKRRLALALKLDEARVTELFSGARAVLKRSVDPTTARAYVDKLARLGARVHLEPADAPPTTGFPPLPELPETPAGPIAAPWGVAPRPALPVAAPAAAATPVPPPPSVPMDLAPLGLAPVGEVTCPNCGERQPKRLLCRQCTTNIEMALANQQAEADAARAARLERMNARQMQRSGRSAGGDRGAGIFGLGFEGRIGRLKYATANLVMASLMFIPLVMLLQQATFRRTASFLVAALAVTAFGVRLAVLRCHDCDKSGWWSMLLWLPTVNVIVTLVLSFAPGTSGSNDYGDEPPPPSWAAFGVAALCAALLSALLFSRAVTALERMAEDKTADDGDVQFQSDPRAASLPGTPAQAGFNEDYLPARTHKAFAVSPAGGWGWVAGRSSPQDAMGGALEACEARRPAYTAPCSLVNLNGRWAPER
jgi:uncharacterized membrane protein YhaH (DUF805 family)